MALLTAVKQWFKPAAVVEPQATQWLIDTYLWALEQFDSDFFQHHTVLVLPNERFFPGRADHSDAMANLILDHVKRYAGTTHWPLVAVSSLQCQPVESLRLAIEPPLRRPAAESMPPGAETALIPIPYLVDQLTRPEGMIATFAHVIGHYLAQMGREPPPGGEASWGYATELLAIYMGFGVMFANSAFTHRGGCGSCYNPNAVRQANLSELESLYALALFAALKRLPPRQITPHLKRHLRSHFRRFMAQIERHSCWPKLERALQR